MNSTICPSGICPPAILYLVFALILVAVVYIIATTNTNISGQTLGWASLAQLITIIISTLILMGLCNLSVDLTWAIVIIIIILTLIGLASFGIQSAWQSPFGQFQQALNNPQFVNQEQFY